MGGGGQEKKKKKRSIVYTHTHTQTQPNPAQTKQEAAMTHQAEALRSHHLHLRVLRALERHAAWAQRLRYQSLQVGVWARVSNIEISITHGPKITGE